jgi:glucose 1-dehydrogenase
LNYNSNDKEVLRLKDKFTGMGLKSEVFKANVSQEEEVRNLVDFTIEKLGHIDILINNAGISYHKKFLDMDMSDWDTVIDINLKSYFMVSQLCARHMADRGERGKIINNSSMVEAIARPNLTTYCVSKGGIGALARSLAVELAPYNIQVNNVNPGIIETKILGDKLEKEPEFKQHLIDLIPMGRLGQADECADLFVFLASQRANYITGASYYIDGGVTIAQL